MFFKIELIFRLGDFAFGNLDFRLRLVLIKWAWPSAIFDVRFEFGQWGGSNFFLPRPTRAQIIGKSGCSLRENRETAN